MVSFLKSFNRKGLLNKMNSIGVSILLLIGVLFGSILVRQLIRYLFKWSQLKSNYFLKGKWRARQGYYSMSKTVLIEWNSSCSKHWFHQIIQKWQMLFALHFKCTESGMAILCDFDLKFNWKYTIKCFQQINFN